MIILGSTGSVGTQALEILKAFKITPEVLVAGENIHTLAHQIKEHQPKIVVIKNAHDIIKLKTSLSNPPKILCGQEGIKEALLESQSKIVLNALVGLLGLLPTLEALKLGKQILLANKESLVTIGHLIEHHMGQITPVDSEHFSIAYLLGYFTERKKSILSEIIITSSGGSLRDTPIELIANATRERVLNHPNWSMGAKITLDSSTMVNKLFEILECLYLFSPFLESRAPKKISAIIEKSSLVHAMTREADGTLSAHISAPDMRLPLSYAIDPNRAAQKPYVTPLGLSDLIKIDFQEISTKRYPLYELKDTLLDNPKYGVLLNSANEILNPAFLNGKISFGDISGYMLETFSHFATLPKLDSIFEILEFHKEVSSFVKSLFE